MQWHVEALSSKEPSREEQDFEPLDLTSSWIESSDDFAAKLLGLLLWIRAPRLDVENVPDAVVAKGQFLVHAKVASALLVE
jgi:hypothetical protein